MSEQSQESVVRTYGGWRREQSVGLGAFSLGQSLAVLVVGFSLVMVNLWAGWRWSALFALGAVAVAAATLWKDRYGMNFFNRKSERMRFLKAKRKGRTGVRAGVLSAQRKSDGRCRLPGVLGKVSLTSHVDAYRRPFGMLRHSDGHVTIVLGIAPDGERLKDKSQIDDLVSAFGSWLACLSNEVGLIAASITVETSPESGQRLRAKVRSQRGCEVPDVAQEVIEGVLAATDCTGARISCWATLSFEPANLGKGKQAVDEIATRLPTLTQTLVAGGAGAVHVMDRAEIAQMARIAYDPGVEALIESAAAKGQQVEIEWEDAGPGTKLEGWDAFRHDSAISCTWVQRVAPRGTVQHRSLRRLLEATNQVPRKRVTMIYRPLDPARAPDVVERAVDRADSRLRLRGKRATARLKRDLAQAVQTTTEEASGASILDFGLIITATASGPDADARMVDAIAAVESMASASRFTMRPAFGSQGIAFAMGLPLGVLPHQQSWLAEA
ncbi:Uncharacterised protein [Actinomyces bovis]|uniref:Type VII secretion protein EccE n=1 Tax=Actinomyces bovis TaxID=1658 RepID=A0ABY1VN44_9ACTO|nr:SCO6880 family protein [Actinomyces bovis]SPT53470.1 Uncharacterised protein [Actinomyces bovis]VEG55340.1 Uncharacterised protein [Actinomyces israelii]